MAVEKATMWYHEANKESESTLQKINILNSVQLDEWGTQVMTKKGLEEDRDN